MGLQRVGHDRTTFTFRSDTRLLTRTNTKPISKQLKKAYTSPHETGNSEARQFQAWLTRHQLSDFKDLGTLSLSTLANPLAEGKMSADAQYFSRSVLACSVVSNSLQPLWTVAHQAPLSMGILQARILEWVAKPFSKGPSQLRDWIRVSRLAGGFFTIWPTSQSKESPWTEEPGGLHSRVRHN